MGISSNDRCNGRPDDAIKQISTPLIARPQNVIKTLGGALGVGIVGGIGAVAGAAAGVTTIAPIACIAATSAGLTAGVSYLLKRFKKK